MATRKKLRVAVIGTGMVANAAHLAVLTDLAGRGAVEITTCADIRPEAARSSAARFGIPAWYEDPQRMLDEQSPDLVSICTPNNHHKEWILAALRSGADVICEKPMTLTQHDAQEVFAFAKAAGRRLFPCQCMRWRNYMQQSKNIIERGDIGAPYFSDVAFIRRWGIPTWGMHHMKEHNFGGPFCDLGVHLLDSLFWLMGSPRLISVSGSSHNRLKHDEDILLDITQSGAYAGTFDPRKYDPAEFSVEEFATGSLRLEGNIAVNFRFSWAVNLPTTNLDMTICGDRGGLNVNKEILYINMGRYQTEAHMNWFDNRPYKGRVFEQHWYMYDHIMDVLEGKAEYLITEAQNIEVTRAIECFYRSAEQNREVQADELAGFQS